MIDEATGNELHSKLAGSLASSVLGVMQAGAMGVSLIGAALATSQGLDPKHATKQVDRLLSNPNLQLEQLDAPWVRFVLGERKDVVIALDWTDYARDGHSVIAANVVTAHGRATPLCWKTVRAAELSDGGRIDAEDTLLLRLRSAIPDDVRVTIIADRGFGGTALYKFLSEQTWHFVIRFRQDVRVGVGLGPLQPASKLVSSEGRARLWKNVRVTLAEHPVAGVVTVKAKAMKEPWCLATNRTDLTAAQVVAMYGRRFTIEETFRDAKNARYGLGLSDVRIKHPERRDRLILMASLAQALLTILGAASEATGLDKVLKSNTAAKRTHSLFRQGCMWFSLLPNAPAHRRDLILAKFDELLREQTFFARLFGVL